MQLSYPQFLTHLKKPSPLLPIYVLSGDVPLFIREGIDAFREAAEKVGFTQRELFFVDSTKHWQALQPALEHLSLFAEKSLIEIRNPKAQWDDESLLNFIENPPEDKIILMVTDKLAQTQLKSTAYRAIAQKGAVVSVQPILSREMPAWIQQRFKQAGLPIATEAVHLLAEMTDGNLLAVQQAIEKIQLLSLHPPITVEHITEVMSDFAQYNVFNLSDAVLMGSASRMIRILTVLRLTGVELPLVLWALTRELRVLYQSRWEYEHGMSLQRILANQWRNRQALVQRALLRSNTSLLAEGIKCARRIDTIIKGLEQGDPWCELERLCFTLADDER